MFANSNEIWPLDHGSDKLKLGMEYRLIGGYPWSGGGLGRYSARIVYWCTRWLRYADLLKNSRDKSNWVFRMFGTTLPTFT